MIRISKEEAAETAEKLGIDFTKVKFDLDQFLKGMKVELEHGSKLGADTNVTKNSFEETGRIALAHLEELPDYYDRLHDMEASADKEKLKEVIRLMVKTLL